MNFNNNDTFGFITDLMQSSVADLLKQWSDLDEHKKPDALSNIDNAINFAQRTLYRTVQDLTGIKKLIPLDSLRIAFVVAKAKNKKDVIEFCQKARLKIGDFKLVEIQQLAKNSLQVLEKLYLCLSFQDAYLYVQMGRIVKEIDVTKLKVEINALQLAHDNIALLLVWYRIAIKLNGSYFEDTPEEIATAHPKLVDSCPSLQDIFTAIENTVNVIDQMHIFPSIIEKTLKESENLTNFFVTVDALLIALQHKDRQELGIRKKVAQMFLIQDYIDDSAFWVSEYIS